MANYEHLLKKKIVQKTLLYIFSYLGIVLYFISFLILLCIKKPSLIKSDSFSFILLNSITNLFELIIKEKNLLLYKTIIIFLSYCFQFHLVFTFINKILSGKQLFKSEKDFSLRILIFIEIILCLIIFPYEEFIKDIDRVNFFQNIIIIIFLLCLYEYVKNKNKQIIKYIINNKKNIIHSEQEEILNIYLFLKNICFLNFLFTLIFYITKFLDIRLKKIKSIDLIISILIIGLKEVIAYLFFIGLSFIIFFLYKINKAGIVLLGEEENQIKIDGEENNENGKTIKKEVAQKVEIIEDSNNEKNNNNHYEQEYKKLDKSLNDDNIIEIENLDISNGKEHTNNEEEKLDDEENSKINKETEKIK